MKKMKSKILFTGFLLISMAGFGQRVVDCDPGMIQRIDSVVNYVKEANAEIYTPVDVFIYEFDGEEHYPVIERLSLPSRTPVNRQNYFFDETGRKTYYILQYWNGEAYYDSGRSDYFFNEQGYLEQEVFSGMAEGVWEPYQQHWYNYDENNITQTYLRQMMYSEGVWTDFSYKNYIYNSLGQLIERNEQRISDDVIFWAELFTYDAEGKTAVRVRQSLKYSPDTRTYVMMNLNRQIYSYDIYGELSGYHVETWLDNSWILTGKSVYYHSLIKGNRAAVCHKGQTIIIPASQIAKHLGHGDQMGPCECLSVIQAELLKDDKAIVSGKSLIDKVVVVYPNPVTTEISVCLPEPPGKNASLTLHSRSGSLIVNKELSGQLETINLEQLMPGSYYLTVKDDSGSFITTIIKK